MENSDHLKYMPQSMRDEVVKNEENLQEDEGGIPEETAEINEEIIVVESIAADSKISRIYRQEQEEETPTAKPKVKNYDSLENTGRSVLKLFYDFFNPLLIPTYATLLIFELSLLAVVAPGASTAYTLTTLGITCFAPLVAILILRGLKYIDALSLPNATKRVPVYIVAVLAFGASTGFFLYKGAAPWLWHIYLGATATVVANLLINFKIRISNHCSAIAGALGVLIILSTRGVAIYNLGWWAIGTVALAGILGMGAIVIGKHKIWEVISGYATGILGIILFSLLK